MADTPVGQAAVDAAKNISKAVDAKANPVKASEPNKAPESAQAPAPVDPNAGKEKYVVDGQERWLSPEQAKAYVQKGLAFEPKMDQLGRLQNETAAFLETLANDPAKVIYNERFGTPEVVLEKILNSTKVSEAIKEKLGQWYYKNVVEPAGMSPEQKQAAEWKAKAEEYERMKAAQEEEHLTRENERKVQEALQTIKAQISEAMAEAGVPLDSKIAPQLAKRVAQVMQLGYVTGKVVTPKEAMAKVRNEILETQKAYYDILDEDKLVEQLGKENAEKVRKYYLKAVKATEEKKEKKNITPSAKRDERKTMTPDEFREYLSELKQKGK